MAEPPEERLETILVVINILLIVNVIARSSTRPTLLVYPQAEELDALEFAIRYAGNIDLLLSDVRIPGRVGSDFGAFLKRTRPDTGITFRAEFAGETFWRSTAGSLAVLH